MVSYNLSATASTSASGGAVGSVSANTAFNFVYDTTNFPSDPFTAAVSSAAQLDAEFTSSGPVQLGSLTFLSNSRPFLTTDLAGGYSYQYLGVDITQGGQTFHVGCAISNSNPCGPQTIPIYLAESFTMSVEGVASVIWCRAI